MNLPPGDGAGVADVDVVAEVEVGRPEVEIPVVRAEAELPPVERHRVEESPLAPDRPHYRRMHPVGDLVCGCDRDRVEACLP